MNALRKTGIVLLAALVCSSAFTLGRSWQRNRPAADVWTEIRQPAPSPRDLPNDCEIVASEAASRIAATGAWVRIMHLTIRTREGLVAGHAVTVYQPPTCRNLAFYDQYIISGGGTVNLGIESRDAKVIAEAITRTTGPPVLEAHFIF